MKSSLKAIESMKKRGWEVADESENVIADIKKEEKMDSTLDSMSLIIKENNLLIQEITKSIIRQGDKKKFIFNVQRDVQGRIEKVLAEEI